MDALAHFIVLAALLLMQDYFAPPSLRMVAFQWMGDMDKLYAAYRRRFLGRAIIGLLGSMACALSAALIWPEWIQIALVILVVTSHMALVLLDITKSRSFH